MFFHWASVGCHVQNVRVTGLSAVPTPSSAPPPEPEPQPANRPTDMATAPNAATIFFILDIIFLLVSMVSFHRHDGAHFFVAIRSKTFPER